MLRIRLLGELRLEFDGVDVPPPASRTARLLLAMLALEPRPHTRDALAARLWPDVLDESARTSLRTTLVRLRAAFGEDADRVLDVSRDRVALAGDIWTDVGELETRLAEGDVEAALDLFDGELLAGVRDNWVDERRDELHRRLSDALGELAARVEAGGDLTSAVRLTRRQSALDPLAEEPHRQLIRRLAAGGDRGSALAVYEKLAARLRKELRTAPASATRALANSIRLDTAASPVAVAETPTTRYARSGDVNIAYQVVGNGPIDLVLVLGWISHVDLLWGNPTFAAFLHRLASFSRLIVFDKRGVGASDPLPEPPTFDDRMDDVRAVMDAAGSQRAVVMGYSDGGLLAALFAATHPERTEALVLWDTFATPALDEHDRPDGEVWRQIARMTDDAIEHWGEGRFLYAVSPSVADDPGMRGAFGVVERASLSPSMARMYWEGMKRADVRAALPAIRRPTLVIDFRDAVIPGQRGRYLAAHIPGARFVEVEGRDHLPLAGDASHVADEVERFLAQRGAPTEPSTALATVLAVEDGPIETFQGPTAAITRALGLKARVGLHTGEIRRDGSGLAVEIARQIASLATPGEVLASRTLRDLAANSGARFGEPVVHVLPGVTEEWPLYPLLRPGAT